MGRDPFNQNSNRSDREKRTTSKGGPVFPKLFRLDRTDPLSFGPKFPERLVEWIAPVVTFYIKREIRKFHVEVMQRRQRNVQKSVMHVQSCCFANLNLVLFCRSPWRRRRRCLRYLTVWVSHVPGVFFIHFSSANTSLLFAPKFNAGQIAEETLIWKRRRYNFTPLGKATSILCESPPGRNSMRTFGCLLSSQDRVDCYNSTTSCLLQCVPLR